MDKLKKTLLPVTTFVKIDVKRLFRDKVAIFFVFLFPLIFLAIFGSVFKGDDDVSFRVALLNESRTEFAVNFEKQLNDTQVLEIDASAKTMSEAREKMNRGQLEATIILPSEFGATTGEQPTPGGQATVLYDQNNSVGGQTLGAILEGIFKDINSGIVPNVTPFTVKTESTATKGLTQFDYTFSGIMGFTLLSLGIFGPTNVFPKLKQRGVLRRYKTTSIKVWQYFVGNVLSNAFVGLISATIMFIAATLFFDLNMRGNYVNLLAVVILGVTMLFGIGLAIGGWAKNENQAAPLTQIVTLPMMFLSGVFFPTFLMPDFLQGITRFIPLTPLIDSIRLIVTENASLIELGPRIGIIAAWTVVVYLIAFRLFRWE